MTSYLTKRILLFSIYDSATAGRWEPLSVIRDACRLMQYVPALTLTSEKLASASIATGTATVTATAASTLSDNNTCAADRSNDASEFDDDRDGKSPMIMTTKTKKKSGQRRRKSGEQQKQNTRKRMTNKEGMDTMNKRESESSLFEKSSGMQLAIAMFLDEYGSDRQGCDDGSDHHDGGNHNDYHNNNHDSNNHNSAHNNHHHHHSTHNDHIDNNHTASNRRSIEIGNEVIRSFHHALYKRQVQLSLGETLIPTCGKQIHPLSRYAMIVSSSNHTLLLSLLF